MAPRTMRACASPSVDRRKRSKCELTGPGLAIIQLDIDALTRIRSPFCVPLPGAMGKLFLGERARSRLPKAPTGRVRSGAQPESSAARRSLMKPMSLPSASCGPPCSFAGSASNEPALMVVPPISDSR